MPIKATQISRHQIPAWRRGAQAGTTPPNARALQEKWDSVVNVRVALQGIALLGVRTAIAVV